VARLLLLAVVAGLCLRGVWSGTTPLVVLTALAMFVAGLDTVEPLAQEVDHPTRRDASPLDAAAIHLRHVPMAVLGQLLVAAAALAVAAAPGGGQVPLAVVPAALVPLALGGAGGAIVSVLGGPASVGGGWAMAPPEAQGIRLAFRTGWPPAVAVIGTLPVLFARDAVSDGRAAADGALPFAVLTGVVFALICGWVRVRDDIASWFSQQMGQASGAT
jgi:hypothetical protein